MQKDNKCTILEVILICMGENGLDDWIMGLKAMDELGINRVDTIMNKEVVTLNDDANLLEAIRLFKKHSFNSLPILDRKNKLAGVLSRTDMLKLLVPMKIYKMTGIFSESDVPSVRALMTHPPLTINSDTSIKYAATLIVKHGIRSIPVMEGRNLAGIVTKSDVIKNLLKLF